MASEEEREYARKFLKIIDIVENYQYFIWRRTTGLLYLTIAATISIFLLFGFSIVQLFPEKFAGIVFFIIISLTFLTIWLISINIFKLPKIYTTKEEKNNKAGKKTGITWFLLSLGYILLIIISNFIKLPSYTIPLYTQIFTGLGNFGNYYFSKKTRYYPGKIEKEYLYLSLTLLISSILIPIYKGYEWFIVTIFCLVGTYVFGVYIVLTSDKAFEQRVD